MFLKTNSRPFLFLFHTVFRQLFRLQPLKTNSWPSPFFHLLHLLCLSKWGRSRCNNVILPANWLYAVTRSLGHQVTSHQATQLPIRHIARLTSHTITKLLVDLLTWWQGNPISNTKTWWPVTQSPVTMSFRHPVTRSSHHQSPHSIPSCPVSKWLSNLVHPISLKNYLIDIAEPPPLHQPRSWEIW